MFTVKGRVHYEPTRNFKNDDRTKRWLTVEVPNFEEISKYYRWFINKEWYSIDRIRTHKIEYYRPSHPFHVSVIRGENIRDNIHDWGKFMDGKIISIEYDYPKQILNPPNAKGLFWVCEAYFKEYNELRGHFGLDTERNGIPFTGHITMARAFSC